MSGASGASSLAASAPLADPSQTWPTGGGLQTPQRDEGSTPLVFGRPGAPASEEPPKPLGEMSAPGALSAAEQAKMRSLEISFLDGRFRYRGYAFATLAQAINYADRSGVARPDTPPPATIRPTSPPMWVPIGESVAIAGVIVPGGMIYVGKPEFGDNWTNENCLIDPSLAVAPAQAGLAGHALPYWCSYREIAPRARRAYLQWLSDGRRAQDVDIGFVFLFFYGLERRLFVDRAFDEVGAIECEVDRLLSLYGDNYSFQSYARKLLDSAELLRESSGERPAVSPQLRFAWFEIPLSVRRYLGARLAASEPFDAADALLWLMSMPDTYLRTPGTRCFDELTALWRIRFEQRYPMGLKVRAPKARVSGSYRAASGKFEVKFSATELPDIAAVSAPLVGLRDMLTACTDELDPYSRLLGRRPDARGGLEAALSLPPELWDTPFGAGATQARSAFDELIGDDRVAPVPTGKVLELVGLNLTEGKLTASAQRQLASALDRLDIAFEPDRRYGDLSLEVDGEAVIYRAANGAPLDPRRPGYVAARTMVEVAALAATVDGHVVAAEMESISADLHALPELDAVDRARLLAHAFYLLRAPTKPQAAFKRLARVPQRDRERTAQSATAAILADGRIHPAEVRFLESLFKALGLPQEQVYTALHKGSVQFDEPVVVAPEDRRQGVALPVLSADPPSGIIIDEARLARVRSETSEVAVLLAGIFAEDEAKASTAAPEPPQADAAIDGLDAAHSKLLAHILSSGRLGRPEFEERARALRLLPDGAFETINDWAFDTFDEPVLEGEAEVFIAEHLRDQVAEIGGVR